MQYFLAALMVLVVLFVLFGKRPRRGRAATKRPGGKANAGHPEAPKRRPSLIEEMRASSDRAAEERRKAKENARKNKQAIRRFTES